MYEHAWRRSIDHAGGFDPRDEVYFCLGVGLARRADAEGLDVNTARAMNQLAQILVSTPTARAKAAGAAAAADEGPIDDRVVQLADLRERANRRARSG